MFYRSKYQERFLKEQPESVTTWIIRNEQKQWGSFMSNDEMLLMIQTKRDHFWAKSVPLSSFMAGGSILAQYKGVFAINPEVGFLSKIYVGMGLGLLVGRLLTQCHLMKTFLIMEPESDMAKKYRRLFGNESDVDILSRLLELHDTVLYRSIPMALLLSTGVTFAAYRGLKLPKIWTFGTWGKAMLALHCGFIIGCATKPRTIESIKCILIGK